MDIRQTNNTSKPGKLCALAFNGELTIYSAQVAKTALDDFVGEFESYELDLSAVSECDSSGIQVLVSMQNAVPEMIITRASDCVSSLIKLYGVEGLLLQEIAA